MGHNNEIRDILIVGEILSEGRVIFADEGTFENVFVVPIGKKVTRWARRDARRSKTYAPILSIMHEGGMIRTETIKERGVRLIPTENLAHYLEMVRNRQRERKEKREYNLTKSEYGKAESYESHRRKLMKLEAKGGIVSLYELGWMHACGHGTPMNYDKAIAVWREGAALGCERAAYIAGTHLTNKEVAENFIERRKYTELSNAVVRPRR